MVIKQLFWLVLAGGLGTLARYGLSGWVHRFVDTSFPVGSLIVNALGCFCFGLIWSLSEERLAITPQLRLLILVGFMGAFTTFSTFIFETGALAKDINWTFALFNILAQNGIGILSLMLGLRLAKIV